MKLLIVGMGSIGKRHAENFRSLGHDLAICSSRPHSEWKVFSELATALTEFVPSRVIIANETHLHAETLKHVLESAHVERVLVEKPLYAKLPTQRLSPIESEKVRVAYNMRFHPLSNELRLRLGTEEVVSWFALIGQNLGTWRPGRDYRTVYSAKRACGGGVLRDLSHELDLFHFLAGGGVELLAAIGGKFSRLEMDAEDTFSLILRSIRCAHANIHMNCVDHLGQRRLSVSTNTQTYDLDYIAGTWRDQHGTRLVTNDRNQSYLEMARAFIADDPRLCTYDEAWRLSQIIQSAEAP